MIQIDHIGIAAIDPRSSAEALAAILGVSAPTPDGADNDMFRVDLEGSFLLFSASQTVTLEHVAFRVTPAEFADIVTRLRQRGIAFGNEPEDVRNGRTDDPLGGSGRVYWTDENGHLFEATC